VRKFVSSFDGCSRRAAELAERYSCKPAKSLSKPEAEALLRSMQGAVEVVNPSRLGHTSEGAFPGEYARVASQVMLTRTGGGRLNLPVVVEAWADTDSENEDSDATFMVNGIPCVADAFATHEGKEKTTRVYGCGLNLRIKTGPVRVVFRVNVITPYMPITSDGKAPHLGIFRTVIHPAMEKARKRAKKAKPKSLKAIVRRIVFDNMEQQIVAVSSNRTYRFHWRQVYYRMRPIVMDQAGVILRWGNFSQKLVRRYLREHGDEPMAYRDSRGTFYIPHIGESFPLGTLEVERFERPKYTFNKILVIEKEGYFEALKADGWPERHDCALLTSKGQPTDAARDLIDLIGESDEPVRVFLIHDGDAAGTIIFQSFQDETEARPKRSIDIVNLGLDVEEAMGLASEGLVDIEDARYEKKQPVARYVKPHQAEWLQTHRVELNAFTTAAFINWLDEKMRPYKGKVVPPIEHMAGHLRDDNTPEDSGPDHGPSPV
jgi:hypothetical protein